MPATRGEWNLLGFLGCVMVVGAAILFVLSFFPSAWKHEEHYRLARSRSALAVLLGGVLAWSGFTLGKHGSPR